MRALGMVFKIRAVRGALGRAFRCVAKSVKPSGLGLDFAPWQPSRQRTARVLNTIPSQQARRALAIGGSGKAIIPFPTRDCP